LSFGEVYINPRTEQLVSAPPIIQINGSEPFPLYGSVSRGTVKLTNGGLYIKDSNDNLIVKLTSRDGLVADKFKIDLEGNATFAGELKAATGTFGAVSIAEEGSLTIGNNITINNSGITALNNDDQQTLFIDSENGDVFVRGVIREGTIFEDTLTRDINLSGGTRIINYDDDNELPDGQNPNTIMGTFTANVFANGNNISTDPDTEYL
jgi:hypothetical protein